jgi:serine/threonine-protein kinase
MGAGERWNVNMPAVIGVVFVFLVGVIVWVVASSGGDGAADSSTTTSVGAPGPASTVVGGGSTPSATTPAPMPGTTDVTSPPSTAPNSSSSTTTAAPAPATTAPGAPAGAVPGDLAIAGRPMQRPGCDGGYITVIASAVGAQATAAGIENVLDAYPGSNYLRTDQTCSSLRQNIDGQPIYVVFLGPFAFDVDACTARSQGPAGSYARQLSNDLGPDHSVACA